MERFKDAGNEKYKAKQYRASLPDYTAAIEAAEKDPEARAGGFSSLSIQVQYTPGKRGEIWQGPMRGALQIWHALAASFF